MAASSSSGAALFGNREEEQNQMKQQHSSSTPTSSTAAAAAPPQKKKRNQPGTPNPEAEVIALSPKTLMATNRFICEVCNKGFQREQNLQLHRRGHNLPWKLKQKTTKEPKRKVYLCPEPTCVHHDPSRALGDLTGIKKHFSRKHGEKKWKCEKCSKRYAVQSDWKAHSKTCGTREYRCDCGTLFSRRDSFITHRAFCDALAQESARHPPNLSSLGSNLFGGGNNNNNNNNLTTGLGLSHHHQVGHPSQISSLQDHHHNNNNQSPHDILRLGGTTNNAARTGQFDHLLSPPPLGTTSSSFRPPSASFFMSPDHHHSNQQYHHDHQGLLQNKSFHGLMQFSDHLQTNTNNHPPSAANQLFNLPFLSNSTNSNSTAKNNNNNNLLISSPHHDHFNVNANGTGGGGGGGEPSNLFSSGHIIGDHMSSGAVPSLYSNNQQHAGAGVSHMSATALLQKAAQMGSTTSSNNTTASFLRSFGSSSSSGGGAKSERHQLVNPAANLGGIFGDNDNHLQDLMNSFAGGGSSAAIFGSAFCGGGYDVGASNRAVNLEEAAKLHQNNNLAAVSMGGGSDGLTRDFLGVGQIVRSMSGGFSQRSEQQQQQRGIDHISSLDSESNAATAPSSQSFGGGNSFQ